MQMCYLAITHTIQNKLTSSVFNTLTKIYKQKSV